MKYLLVPGIGDHNRASVPQAAELLGVPEKDIDRIIMDDVFDGSRFWPMASVALKAASMHPYGRMAAVALGSTDIPKEYIGDLLLYGNPFRFLNRSRPKIQELIYRRTRSALAEDPWGEVYVIAHSLGTVGVVDALLTTEKRFGPIPGIDRLNVILCASPLHIGAYTRFLRIPEKRPEGLGYFANIFKAPTRDPIGGRLDKDFGLNYQVKIKTPDRHAFESYLPKAAEIIRALQSQH